MSIIHKGNKIASNAVTGDTLPIGSQVPFGSLTIPDNWLLCDGRAISRVDYSELFAVIGTSYGAGNGSTTFNIPNKKGRTSVGYDSSQTEFNAVGKTGGAKTHTLTVAQMPNHSHSVQSGAKGNEWAAPNFVNSYQYQSTDPIAGYTVNYTGGGQAHNNLQPYQTDVWIIKAKQSSGVVATVVDNLLSTSATNALSAKQGKILNEKITGNDWTTFSLNSEWSLFSSDFNTPAYKKIGDVVYLKGLLKRSSNIINGEVITTLPEGFRPSKRLLVPMLCGNMIQRIDIHPNGEIKVPVELQPTSMLSFEGISFNIN